MRRSNFALVNRPTREEVERDEQELRDILRESDEKAKKLLERTETENCDSPENSLRVATRKREKSY